MEVNKKDWTGRTPLHRAMESCHEATLKLLLERGADVAASDLAGHTPLHLLLTGSIILSTMKHIRLPAEKFGSPEYSQCEKKALAIQRQESAVRLLLKHGADPNSQTNAGDTPLHYAARNCHFLRSTRLIKLLLDNGANPLLENSRRCKASYHLANWPRPYRMVKVSEWRRDKGYIYATILYISTRYTVADVDTNKYTLVKFLYGKDWRP